ncbi:MAG TPA: UDP-N-acetylmuramate dehydrogenase [Massilibacterium sp.]|nr:UDP-N-acetylmuramate dehydrogenase [Massilibacterium sp.]
MKKIYERLNDLQVGNVVLGEKLSNHTTMKIGGPAELFIEPKNIEKLQETIQVLLEENIPWRVIGRGSNLLIPDEGLKGAVIKLSEGVSNLEINGDEIKVGGGYPLIKLATVITKEGLSGLEFAGGIPASVGGAVYMNAGAHGSDISQILKKAHILFEDGTFVWLTRAEMEFSYRTSILQRKKGICVEAVFQLERKNKEEIVEQMKRYKEYRKKTQPWNYPCAGSIFRNPLPNHAGKLIEDLGLKGKQIGGAQISLKHANFIVNTGEATASDVEALIHFVQKEVSTHYNIEIKTEIERVNSHIND